MTVSKINQNKVKIVLSKTEVLCCFGTYERLINMTQTTKAIIRALLREIVEERCGSDNYNTVSAEIHAGKNLGCVIILSVTEQKTLNSYVFEFSNSENLIKAAVSLHCKNRRKKHKSQLYKMPDCYRLIIESHNTIEAFYILQEFCQKILIGKPHSEYTKEYGSPIITENAIFKIAKAFN